MDGDEGPADSWFVVTDIFGGSVNNEFIQRQTDGSFTLIAGMNLPLLVEMVTQLDSLDADKAKAAVEGSRSFIQLCEAADMLVGARRRVLVSSGSSPS